MPATSPTLHKFFEAKPRLVGKVGAGGVASPSSTTIPHTFVGLTNGNAYIVTANRTDSTGTVKNPAASTETFIGVASSGNLINCVRAVEGTAQAWAADTVLEILITATHWNKFIEGLEVAFNADGTIKDGTVLTVPQINDTSKDHQYIFAVNELSADRTVTLPLLTGDDEFVFKAFTQTLTNKRITKRVSSTASSGTPTPNADTDDIFLVTALAANATFGAPTGTPTSGQGLIVRVKDNGTARTLAWNAVYRAIGVSLPTTTVINKTLYLGFIYNAEDTKWDLVAVQQEA